MSTWLAPSTVRFFSSAAVVLRSRSIMTTRPAPREAASKPSAPLPANKSRQIHPGRSWPSQLNNVSRTRSGVGRKPAPSGKSSRRRRYCPQMMRTRLAAPCARWGAARLASTLSSHDDRHQPVVIKETNKNQQHKRHIDRIDLVDPGIQIILGQLVEADQRQVFENQQKADETQRKST